MTITIDRDTRPTLALCLITNDENLDIIEWIEYHRSIGVTNIIIVDNNSSISSLELIRSYCPSGFVHHYEYFSANVHPSVNVSNQIYAYDDCLKNFGKQFTHMGFVDTDEFVVIKNNSATVIYVLESYKEYGGLTLNWMFFGSSGHIERPDGGVLQNYHVKSIIKTDAVTSTSGDPHYFCYKDGYYAVDTSYEKVDGPFNPPSHAPPVSNLYDVMYINHYVIKSVENFKMKHHGGSGDGGRKKMFSFKELIQEQWRTVNIYNHTKCKTKKNNSVFLIHWNVFVDVLIISVFSHSFIFCSGCLRANSLS